MTLLQIIQQAMEEMGLTKPNAVVSSADTTVTQFLALANGLGRRLVKAYAWQALQSEHTFNTVASTASYSLPADFDRFINQTQWDRTNTWPMNGPQTGQQWQDLKSGISSAGLRKRYRVKGNLFYIDPTPSSVDACAFEYISSYFALDTDGTTYKAAFAADTDTSVFDDLLMTDGLKLAFAQAKGFDTSGLANAFNATLLNLTGTDGGAPKLNLAPVGRSMLMGYDNIPETGYGS